MKVTIKILNQQTIEIDIAEDKSVLELKETIFNMFGHDYMVERQKLICGGTIMDDEKEIALYSTGGMIVEMIVVMLRGRETADSQYNTTIAAAAKVATSATQIVVESESLFLTGQDYEQAVAIMVEIGFDRTSVERAMAASFNNPERAFKYLTNELFEHNDETQASAASSATNAQINAETFHQILDLLRQNPNLLMATLQQMGVTNTDNELLEQILNNLDAFLNSMRQNEQTGDSNNQRQVITTRALDEFRRSNSAATIAADDDKAERAAIASFTPDDRAAIERLKAMGFQEAMVVSAYIAFDKEEALAANFLASNVDDEN